MRGGARPNAGRKTKDDEDRIRTLGIKSIKKIFGSEQAGFDHIAQNAASGAKDSFAWMKLLMEYVYGKPKEKIDMNVNATHVVDLPEVDE